MGRSPSRNGGSGGGVVIRDHHGAFLAATCHHFSHIVDPALAEILACKRALQVATEVNAMRVHVELDAKEGVDMLNQPHRVLSAVGPWIQEIKTAFGMFEDVKISWARRSANGAAHKLAKVGVGDKAARNGSIRLLIVESNI
ncbi:WD repeat domain phosphoinositide-interacting protein 3 [Hordeum vulgare]|nr:WD repeat domain phosphoinositide-interacting protein 3 [Hordeum vulgare]